MKLKTLIIVALVTIALSLEALPAPSVAQVKADIRAVSLELELPQALLLAIAERESDFGESLDANWSGDKGHGRGVFQIDDRYHAEFIASGKWRDTKASARYAAGLIKANLKRFDGQWFAAIAAYNCGAGNVSRALRSGRGVDSRTTGRNYSRDVWQRALRHGLLIVRR